MAKQGKRRPRWGRIFGVLGGFMLCIAAVIALVRLVTAPPVEEIVAPDNGTGGGLQFSPTSASGWVLSFTDPGVSLDGLRPATMDFGANYPANDTCAYCPLTLDKPYSSRRALARALTTPLARWTGCVTSPAAITQTPTARPACPPVFTIFFWTTTICISV